jgi:L-lysine exporter family protein LysE/ArgO
MFVQGALVSGGLIIAIGAQNTFILRQGLLRQKVLYAFAVCFICDVILITLGISGVGSILQKSLFSLNLLAIFGAIFLFWYGGQSFIRAYKGNSHYWWHRRDIGQRIKILVFTRLGDSFICLVFWIRLCF